MVETLLARDELIAKGYKNGGSCKDIACEFGLCSTSIWKRLKKLGVKLRTKQEAIRIKSKRPSESNLYQMYVEEKQSVYDISHVFGVAPSTVYRWVKESDVPTRDKITASKMGLEKHPHEPKYKPDLTPSPNLAYILGVLCGDGFTVSSRYLIALQVTSKPFAENFYNALKGIGLNPSLRSRPPKYGKELKPVHSTNAYSKTFIEWFKNLTLSDIQGVAEEQPKLEQEFIRGLYESEAYIGESKTRGSAREKTLRIFNTNKALLEAAQAILLDLGINFKIYGPYLRKPYKALFYLGGSKRGKIERFLELINPCIKNPNLETANA